MIGLQPVGIRKVLVSNSAWIPATTSDILTYFPNFEK
jgi:hypothetical protein